MKNLFTIKGHISLILGSFFLLVVVSVGVMNWNINTQESDALIINLAGRQRMLSQKLNWLALTDLDNPEFQESIKLFEQTLLALRDGGETVDSAGNIILLPPSPDIEIRDQLDDVSESWTKFKDYLITANSEMISKDSPLILSQIDSVVSSFESRAEDKHQRLEMIQLIFLIAGLLLLAWGYILTQNRIVKRLAMLNTAVKKMTEGDLHWKIPSMDLDELGELALAFETMQTELAASREVLELKVNHRTRELVSAFEFSQELVAEREQTELIKSVVERARILMDAESSALCIISSHGNELEMVANSGVTKINPGLRNEIRSELTLTVVGDGKTVIEKTSCLDCAFLDENPDGQCVVTPLRSMDRTIGALCVLRNNDTLDDGEEIFGPEGQRALALLANSAAIAITNTRLAKLEYQKVEEEATLSERELLAANLHDDLAQTLSFTRMKLENLEEVLAETPLSEERTNLNQIIDAIDSAYDQVRNALTGLMKTSLKEKDFFKKLSAMMADFNRDCDCKAELRIINPSALEFPTEIQVQISHVLGEALSNIQQHAKSNFAIVTVEKLNNSAIYSIEDDGIGFDPGFQVEGNHFGLQIMQTRIERSGGVFEIKSTPNEGTKISLSFPVEMLENMVGQNHD